MSRASVGGCGRRRQVRDAQVEVRAPDVGQSLHLGVGRQERVVADAQAADPGREVVDLARHLDVDVREERVPLAQLGREIGHVVGRDLRAADGAVEAHLADELLVLGPRTAGHREVGNREVGAGRGQHGVLESETAVGQVEAAGEVLEREAAALRGAEGPDIGRHGGAVDRQLVDAARHAVQVHVAEIDAVGRIAVAEALDAELHVLDRRAVQREPEIAFFRLVRIGEAVDDLLDVHHPLRRLVQTEPRVDELAAAQRHAAAEDPEARDERIEPVDVEQRIVLVILDVEARQPDLAQESDIDAPQGDRGAQLAGDGPHDPLRREVLHGRQVQQQREGQRKNHEQQNRRRDHLSQYFYTFAHRVPVITCKVNFFGEITLQKT